MEKPTPVQVTFLTKTWLVTNPPPPPPWEKFWTSDLASLKKVEVQTPPHLEKILDFRFGILEKSWSPEPPPPTWEKFWTLDLASLKKVRVRIPPPVPPPWEKIWTSHLASLKKVEVQTPPPPPHPEKKFGLQICNPWKKLKSRPPPPPKPWEKIWTSDLASLKKVEVQTLPPPPPLRRKNLDFRFGILEKCWSPDPPPPPGYWNFSSGLDLENFAYSLGIVNGRTTLSPDRGRLVQTPFKSPNNRNIKNKFILQFWEWFTRKTNTRFCIISRKYHNGLFRGINVMP